MRGARIVEAHTPHGGAGAERRLKDELEELHDSMSLPRAAHPQRRRHDTPRELVDLSPIALSLDPPRNLLPAGRSLSIECVHLRLASSVSDVGVYDMSVLANINGDGVVDGVNTANLLADWTP